MKTSTYLWIVGILAIILGAAFTFSLGAFTFMEPTNFQPGDKVVRVYQETVIIDDHVCQKTTEGIVAYTGINNSGKWYGAKIDFTRLPFVFQALNIVNADSENTQEMVTVNDLDLYKSGNKYCSTATINKKP